MGIKNLKIILNNFCKCAINKRKLNNYSGTIMAIDISIYLYKYLYNNNDHIEGLTRLILRLLKNNITPIFIFDGAPPKEKNDVLQMRKDRRNSYISRKEDIKNILSNKDIDKDINIEELKEEMVKLERKIIFIKNEHIDKAKALIENMGIKYIVANGEAEELCADLCKNKLVDGCISEDTDILANGSELFLINFNADNNNIEEYCLVGILNTLELNYDEFVDLCILCGCDYTSKINGLGPIGSYKLIKKYRNIEKIIEEIKNNKKYIIPENFDYIKARMLFNQNNNIEVCNNLKNEINVVKKDINVLIEFLKNNSSKLKERYYKEIINNLHKYIDNINNNLSIT